MKVSVSSYSFAQQIWAGKMTQLDCVAKAKEMGFDAIEFTDIDGAGDLALQKENAKKIREEADRVGIEINAYTIGANLYSDSQADMDAEVERLKGQVDVAKILGAKVMRHDVCYTLAKTGASRSFGLMLPTIADGARQVTAYAEKLGIKTCTENHGYIAQDSYRVEQLFNAVAHDNYGLLVDIGNFLCADEDPAMAVSRVAPYAVHVHLKDYRLPAWRGEVGVNRTLDGHYTVDVPLGAGCIDFAGNIQLLEQFGYRGCYALEFTEPADGSMPTAKAVETVANWLQASR